MLSRHLSCQKGLSCVLIIALCTAFAQFRLATVRAQEGNQEGNEEHGWQAIAVPEVWKNPPEAITAQGQGYAWFRCRFTAPQDWAGGSFALWAEAADDARQYYLNGVQVAAAGEFPPDYRSGLGEPDQHALPPSAIRPGEENVLAIRMFQQQSRTNFNVAAPVVLSDMQAIWLKGTWEMHIGDLPVAEASREAGQESFASVITAAEAQANWKRLEGDDGPQTIEQALARFQVPADLELELAVGDPDIGQPLSIKFDARGRLWVMQYLQYPNPAGLTMVSRDKFLRTVWDKVPPPPPHHFRGADKITIHEDTDGDGRYDKTLTFVDGLNMASSFAFAPDGLWVLNPPYLLFYPDRDHDDQPDGDPEVHLEGFGLEDSHSIASHLRWGPDGWLYASQGSTVTGQIKHYGVEEPRVHSMGQLIWRYHPVTRQYEIFAEGGGNTFGVEIDDKGRIYSGHNGGDTRGFHYVQGGYYQKGFGKHGELSNPFAYGYFPQMAHHAVPRFTHTFTIYQARDLPENYWGKLFGVEPLQGRVVMSQVEPDRSSFKTQDIGYAVTTTDPWFRPVDIQLGPDGALYICDFYEQRIDHSSHYQGRIDKTTGRVYRLRAKGAPRAPALNMHELSSLELLDLLQDANRWKRQTALDLLAARGDTSLVSEIDQRLEQQPESQYALELLWARHRLAPLDDAATLRWLRHADPFVRLWTVRLACDDGQVSSPTAEALRDLAAREQHVEVRSQLAASARRLPAAACMSIVGQLMRHDEDAGDIHIPLLLWWAIEAHAVKDRAAVLAMMADPSLWQTKIAREHLLERLMRRYASTGVRADLLACAELLRMAPQAEDAERLMKGFEKAFEGRLLVGLPSELVDQIAVVGGGSFVLKLRQGDEAAIAEALRLLSDEQTDTAQRTLYIQVLSQIRYQGAVTSLLNLVRSSPQPPIRIAALGALQTFADPAVAPAILEVHDALPDDVRGAAQSVLASRPEWTIALLEAIQQQRCNAALVPLPLVRRLLLHDDPQIAERVEQIWGNVDGASTEQMRAATQQLTEILNQGVGNPYNGKVLFGQQCGKCHVLFNQGGMIGPDLTPYGRDDINRMLANIINPSLEIREGFENYVIITADGRSLNGFVADQDNQTVVLRDAEGQTIVVPRDDIEEMHAIPRSIMPEGLLQEYTEQQVRDLFAYLRSTQPLP